MPGGTLCLDFMTHIGSFHRWVFDCSIVKRCARCISSLVKASSQVLSSPSTRKDIINPYAITDGGTSTSYHMTVEYSGECHRSEANYCV